jgi:iron-sulfur cluster assembly protein
MITLTENAAAKVKDLMDEAKATANPDSEAPSLPKGLRLFVTQGGCDDSSTAYQYGMSLEPEPKDGDHILEQHGLQVFVDRDAAPYLSGIEIDYGETPMGKGFLMRNPNAIHTCGCGHTFTPKEDE